ncbi:MAG: hypothetical protein HQL58_12260 [Magnetococcales bacterium]|nr:hypothetical protein [Magnetococcales bacterium]
MLDWITQRGFWFFIKRLMMIGGMALVAWGYYKLVVVPQQHILSFRESTDLAKDGIGLVLAGGVAMMLSLVISR